jgi:urease accessory protein
MLGTELTREFMHRNQNKLLSVLGLLLSLSSSLAEAHTGSDGRIGWDNGFNHPLRGRNHLPAMFAVGVWAAPLGGLSVWQLPLAFVGVMGCGGLVGIIGISMPGVGMMIGLSVIVFSFLIIRRIRVQEPVSALTVAFFAFFHGYAHGQEMPATASLLLSALGFLCWQRCYCTARYRLLLSIQAPSRE